MIKKIISKWYVQFIVLMLTFTVTNGILEITIPHLLYRLLPKLELDVISAVISIIFNLITSIVLVLVYKLMTDEKLSDIGYRNLKEKRNLLNLFFGLFIGALSISIVFFGLFLMGYVAIREVLIPEYLFLFFLMFVSIAIVEETLARGVLQSAVRHSKSVVLTILLPSIFFGAIHMANTGISTLAIINTVLAGIVFALFTHITNDIYIAIGFHITWNFFQSSIFGMTVSGMTMKEHKVMKTAISGPNILNGGTYGVEGGIFCSIVFILIILLQLTYAKKQSSTAHNL